MLLFYSRFYLLWKRRLIYCFLADSSVSYGKKKKHDCTHCPTLFRENVNYAFYVIRSPGESMTEILFPSRLSNVNSYHSLIICYIGRVVRPLLVLIAFIL